MSHYNCCVPHCTNSFRNAPCLHYYRIPKDPDVRKKYVVLIRNETLKGNIDERDKRWSLWGRAERRKQKRVPISIRSRIRHHLSPKISYVEKYIFLLERRGMTFVSVLYRLLRPQFPLANFFNEQLTFIIVDQDDEEDRVKIATLLSSKWDVLRFDFMTFEIWNNSTYLLP